MLILIMEQRSTSALTQGKATLTDMLSYTAASAA